MRFVNWGGARDGVPDRLSRQEAVKQWQKRHGHYACPRAGPTETRKRRAERADGARLPLWHGADRHRTRSHGRAAGGQHARERPGKRFGAGL